MSEEILRKKGIDVDAGKGGDGGPPPEGESKILLDLEKGDLSGNQALAAAMKLAEVK